ICPVMSGEVGLTLLGHEPASLPSLSIRYLWKFHFGAAASPASPEIHWKRPCASAPTTFCFACIGKVTPKLVSQNLAISASVLGSCAPKSFDGTPSTASPLGP